jgi:hypothetical protein
MLNITGHQRNQNDNKKPLHTYEDVNNQTSRQQKIPSVSKGAGKLNPQTLIVEMENGAVTMENRLAAPQKVK